MAIQNLFQMPATKNMPGLPQRGARVSLHQPVTNILSTFPRKEEKEKVSSTTAQ